MPHLARSQLSWTALRLRPAGAYLLASFTFDTSQSPMVVSKLPVASIHPSSENTTDSTSLAPHGPPPALSMRQARTHDIKRGAGFLDKIIREKTAREDRSASN